MALVDSAPASPFEPPQRLIEELAHALWEEKGRPEKRSVEIWQEATRRLREVFRERLAGEGTRE